MNKYMVKVAQMLSDENEHIGKTFLEATAADIPAAAAGAAVGGVIGSRYGRPKLGTFVGGHIAGGLATLAAMKHSLHGKVQDK